MKKDFNAKPISDEELDCCVCGAAGEQEAYAERKKYGWIFSVHDGRKH